MEKACTIEFNDVSLLSETTAIKKKTMKYNVDAKDFQCFEYTQEGVAPPFSLGDVVIDTLGDVSVIIQGFGVDDTEYSGDMNGVQSYEGTRYATKEEIINLRIDLWNYILNKKNEQLIYINKIIAEFMGYNVIQYNGDESRLIYNGNKFANTINKQRELWGGLDLEFTGRFVKSVQYPFNTEFTYLIPVIKRIEEMGYVVHIAGISYKIYGLLQEKNPIISLVCGDLSAKTEMTCDLIISFIEKFNQNKL